MKFCNEHPINDCNICTYKVDFKLLQLLKVKDYGKFTLHYCRHTDNRLAYWIYRLRCWRYHSHFTRNCYYSSADAGYTRKKIYINYSFV